MSTRLRRAAGAETRARAAAFARAWIGTPYHHQASLKGVGCDCLGLVRGVWKDLYGDDAETPPPYTPDWAETGGRETLIDAAARHLISIPKDSIESGDVVVFRLKRTMVAKHAGLMTGSASFVHAIEGAPVADVALSPWWRRRIAAAFRFPEV
jgi:NlpC/P60 family putative phage cell wall peptidase